MKVFDNYLSLVKHTYYGLPTTSAFGKSKSENTQQNLLNGNGKKLVMSQNSNFQNGSANGLSEL